MEGLEWNVLHKCFHSLVASQTSLIIELGGATVAVLGTLPEQALIVAQEWSTLHL